MDASSSRASSVRLDKMSAYLRLYSRGVSSLIPGVHGLSSLGKKKYVYSATFVQCAFHVSTFAYILLLSEVDCGVLGGAPSSGGQPVLEEAGGDPPGGEGPVVLTPPQIVQEAHHVVHLQLRSNPEK